MCLSYTRRVSHEAAAHAVSNMPITFYCATFSNSSSSLRSGLLSQIHEKSAEIFASTEENGVAVVTNNPKINSKND